MAYPMAWEVEIYPGVIITDCSWKWNDTVHETQDSLTIDEYNRMKLWWTVHEDEIAWFINVKLFHTQK